MMNIDFECEAPTYDAGTTRAVTYNWGTGATIFARLKSGSTYVKGMVTRKSDGHWSLRWWGELAQTTTAVSCELYYLQENNGDYYVANDDTNCLDIYNNGTLVRTTTIPWNTETIDMSESTCVYGTTEGTYTYPGTYFSMKAILKPLMWRLRFKGANNTSITLPGSSNDIKYCNKFTWKAAQTLSLTKAAKDVALKVSSGYTPYIYGEFMYNYSGNSITVKNGSDEYKRDFMASNLPLGTSGYFDIPTSSNYSSNGWTKKGNIDNSATVQPNNALTFTDGIVTGWTLGSTVSTFYYTVFTKSGAESLSDEELAAELYGEQPYTMDYADYWFNLTSTDFFSANTEYYLCAVAKNSSGKRGPVLRYKFKTNSSSLPYAQISNIMAATSTRWTYNITLKNNAKCYYLATSSDSSDYTLDWHFYAFYVYNWATNGQLETHDWESVQTTLNSGTCNVITIATWGVSSTGAIGNPQVAYGNVSSSAPKRVSGNTGGKLQKDFISKKNMEKMMENTKLYRINNE